MFYNAHLCIRNYLIYLMTQSFSLTAHMGPAVCLVVMTYVGCDATTAIIMLILALAFNGAACQTSLQNHQDLAPNYAGSLYGIMNTFGSFPGFIIPPIIGALTNERVRSYIKFRYILIFFIFNHLQIFCFHIIEWR